MMYLGQPGYDPRRRYLTAYDPRKRYLTGPRRLGQDDYSESAAQGDPSFWHPSVATQAGKPTIEQPGQIGVPIVDPATGNWQIAVVSTPAVSPSGQPIATGTTTPPKSLFAGISNSMLAIGGVLLVAVMMSGKKGKR